MIKRLLPITILLISITAAAADPQRLTAEVLWQLERAASPAISPDGRQVVVTVTTYPADMDEADVRLWLLDVSDKAAQRPLTAEGAKSSSPVFSPDGSQLAFVSKRSDDEAGQVYVLPMDGPGEAVRLTDVPTGAGGLKWVGDYIYFVSSVWPDKAFEEMADRIEADKDSKLTARVWNRMPYSAWDHYLDEEKQNHVYRVAAKGGDVEALTLGTGWELPRDEAGASEYDVSPDGNLFAFVANSRREGVYPNPDIFLLRVGSTDATNITADNEAPDFSPLFSPDGKSLAFSRQRIVGFYGDQARLMIRDLESGRTRMVHENWDRSVQGLVWSPDGAGLFATIGDAATNRVFFLPLDEDPPRRITNDTDFGSLVIASDGTLIAINQSLVYPPRVVRVDTSNGTVDRLESFNDAVMANVAMGTYESVTYKGADGDDIQMWVNYPPGFDPKKKYPLFLLIHGGPHGAISDTFHFRWNAQTFSSWGYVTAWPNFHGSSSFGQAFTDSINPDWVTKPYADVIAAAEWLMDKPWIDNDRVVAGGGSYGGYLSSILLGREHPFSTLVIHAAVYDLYAQMAADFAVHDQRYGPYWENPELYRTISPHYFADSFKTPSLIIHGQNDLRVPVGQAFEMFRTLQTKGIESRLVYYPDENHWILSRDNSIHWYGEVRDWIARFAESGPKRR